MPVDIFNKQQFEAVLPMRKDGTGPAWRCIGLDKGEYTYVLPLDNKPAQVLIRSSIDDTSWSRSTGRDSIRVYVVDSNLKPLSGKANRYTTRLPGWNERMMEIVRFMAGMAVKIGMCPNCKKDLTRLNKVKKAGPNKGRWFLSCMACNNHFQWLDSRDNDDDGDENENKTPPCPKCNQENLKKLTVKKEGPNKGKQFYTCSTEECGFFQWADEFENNGGG